MSRTRPILITLVWLTVSFAGSAGADLRFSDPMPAPGALAFMPVAGLWRIRRRAV